MGWMPEEFNVGEQDFKQRVKELMKCWVMQRLWSEKCITMMVIYSYEDLEMLPKPYGDIPILIGGFSKIALKRASNHNGWISDMHRLGELEEIISSLEQLRKDKPSFDEYEITAFSCWDAFQLGGFKDARYWSNNNHNLSMDALWGNE